MKRVLLLLLFVNVVYFLWSQLETAKPVNKGLVAPLYNATSTEVLKLVQAKEVKKLMKVRLVKKAALENLVLEELLSVGPKRIIGCYMLGDFSNAIKAAVFAKQLQDLTGEAAVVPTNPRTKYWVIYPAGKTLEESMENVNMLKSKNEVDLWLVLSGEDKGVISLGLYREESRAGIRLQTLLDKKINAKITTRVKYRYRVRVKIFGGLGVLKTYLEKKGVVENAGISKISC